MFNDIQLSYIEKCKSAGWGWKKFAESVEVSGSCTQKQEDTLFSMCCRISHNKALHERAKAWVTKPSTGKPRSRTLYDNDEGITRTSDYY